MQGSFNPEIGGSVVVVSYCSYMGRVFSGEKFPSSFCGKMREGPGFETFFLGEPKQFVTAWYGVRT